jgi:hypothetical protein
VYGVPVSHLDDGGSPGGNVSFVVSFSMLDLLLDITSLSFYDLSPGLRRKTLGHRVAVFGGKVTASVYRTKLLL